jgi:Zinc-binding dehydrogenase
LRADQIIDFKRERFEDKVHALDAVVDLVGGDTLARSYAVVKSGAFWRPQFSQLMKQPRSRRESVVFRW